MQYFIFRNYTIENLFNTFDVSFSGYDDILCIDQKADGYIWCYQIPIKYDVDALISEVEAYFDKLYFCFSRIVEKKPFLVFSLENLSEVRFCDADYRLKETIDRFNRRVREFAEEHQNIKFIDFSEFLRCFPSDQWIDWKYYYVSQIVINPRLVPFFKKWFLRKLDSISLKRKKCLVLDLDNTLWGGVLGEEGMTGIKIGGDYPGNAFLYFQKALVALSKSGIILTICSKNNETDVLEVWEKNPFIVLKKEYISAYRINWQNKADNIMDLAKELNIGLDSFVFIDDNPSERELVKQMLPMVEVPDFPDKPYLLPSFFDSLVNDYFRVYTLTDEDKQKTLQYRANIRRAEEQAKFVDMESYFASLQLKITIEKLDSYNLSRIAQMTQKTNQFNLTTKRYTESDILSLKDNGWHIYCIRVEDKFGDNGITGTIFLQPINEGWIIDSLLFSCRILGKGIEFAFMQSLLYHLKEKGYSNIEASYFSTLKNEQVSHFYDQLGFALVDEDALSKYYHLDLSQWSMPIKSYYNIIYK